MGTDLEFTRAPLPVESPIAQGTKVRLDDQAVFIDRDLISGGSPWRLLRLAGGSKLVAERWRGGGEVGAGEGRFARTLVQQGLLHPVYDGPLSLDDVEVIVPVYDDVNALRTLLETLVGFHVTIVDDASHNASAIATCANDFDAKLIVNERNAGPALARNLGARASTRAFFWFIDEDVTIVEAIEVARRLHAPFADPLVAAVAPRVTGTAGSSRRDRFEEHFSPLDMGEQSGLVVPTGPVGYVPSACLMVRAEAFGDGFDPALRVGEDVDFVWRLSDRGWLVRYDADVVVTHRARTTWRDWWLQRQRYGESSAQLAKRHGARLAPLRVDRWTLAAWTSVLVGQPAIGARIVRSAREHAKRELFASSDHPDEVAREVVVRNMMRAGGPLARGVVRTFGTFLLLGAIHPRLRRRLLVLFLIGTAWRWRRQRVHVADLPLGVIDDLAYGAGVVKGAWTTKSLRVFTPHITKSSLRVRDALGLASIKRITQR
jgi:mycofactocin system glycosyltransferase